ncbi:hypothetical protein MMC26_003385 [Xylographa opegraphella]|nr:hypothetical protein [Xylographa opegraphella]
MEEQVPNITNGAAGDPRSTTSTVLETAAAATQCLIYDAPDKGARLIGVEYMVSPRLFATLPPAERRLWHSHVYEVKSGMLIMPQPALVPRAGWERAETLEMEQVVGLYGKTYHFWQVDRGDVVPMGAPELMMSFTAEEQLADKAHLVKERDKRFATDWGHKREIRKGIEEPTIEAGELAYVVSERSFM